MARVRRVGDAARRRDHQARPGPRRLRGRAAPGAGGVRRQGDAALRARAARAREVVGLTGLLAPGDDAPEDLRGELIEGVIEESEDETLMDRYVGGEEIAEDVLTADLERAVARATFFPVVPVCSVTGIGCTELLDLARARLPLARRAPGPRRVHARGQGRRARSRATPPARWSPRS